jgi:hypothetical protein
MTNIEKGVVAGLIFGVISNRDGWFELVKNKKIETIDLDYSSLDGFDEIEDAARARRFHFVTREIERLQFTHDTSVVLKIDLGENNSYGEFVWLYNHMAFYRIRHYAFIDKELVLKGLPPLLRGGRHLITMSGTKYARLAG